MNNLKITLSIITSSIVLPTMAQGEATTNTIEGGLGLLLAGGVAYGINHIIKDCKKLN